MSEIVDDPVDKPYEMYLDAGNIGESNDKAEEFVVKVSLVQKNFMRE